jgi:hypothetical protein
MFQIGQAGDMGQARAESKGATYISEKNASNTRHSKPSMDELSLHVPL